jgi:hypothetical protein
MIGKAPGGYWIDTTGEAEINGKTAAQIIEEENRKVAAAEAKRRKEAEEKAAEEQRKVLQQKEQQAKSFMNVWHSIYDEQNRYTHQEGKKLRTVIFSDGTVAVTNAPTSAGNTRAELSTTSRFITKAGANWRITPIPGSSRGVQNLPDYWFALRLIIGNEQNPMFWVDMTDTYKILAISLKKESRNRGEQSRASMAGLGYLMDQAMW